MTINGPWLLNLDYDVQVTLSLEVTDTGGLAPSFSYATPLSVGTFLNVGASATLSEARDIVGAIEQRQSARLNPLPAYWKLIAIQLEPKRTRGGAAPGRCAP